MDNSYVPAPVIETRQLRVRIDEHWHVANLRYFDTEGEFARRTTLLLGHALPPPLAISASSDLATSRSLLAWKSPTESLLLCVDYDLLHALAGIEGDGCCVDQTGGRRIVRIEGARGADLMARLGGVALDPPVGGASPGRLAELPALSLKLRHDLRLLVVERFHFEHLLRWIELTVSDLD